MILHREYHQHPNPEKIGVEIKAYISYNLDRKEYRVCVLPVKRSKLDGGVSMEESEAMSGFNDTLLKVTRRSEKLFNQAKEILKERMPKYLEYFSKKEIG